MRRWSETLQHLHDGDSDSMCGARACGDFLCKFNRGRPCDGPFEGANRDHISGLTHLHRS